MTDVSQNHFFDKRRAGILLHLTSLPGNPDQGDMGHSAYRFIEFLSSSGMHVWQILPLCPTHEDRSPYNGLSVHAGNPLLISLDWLIDRNLLDRNFYEQQIKSDSSYRLACLKHSYQRFIAAPDTQLHKEFSSYRQDTPWLRDFSLYHILRELHQHTSWWKWEIKYRIRDPAALQEIQVKYQHELAAICFYQFIFSKQWHELRTYAHQRDVVIFGDMPLFVAHDSADVWANPDSFLLDEKGFPEQVAGVPPDYFSKTGQRWGNPVYNWKRIQANGFQWWLDRFNSERKRVDLLRIDHFRGLQAYWSIPASKQTAQEGNWMDAPGDALLQKMFSQDAHVTLVAEDLGTITDDVLQLRDKYHLPGMKILQFAFDGNPANNYLPHHHTRLSVVYTGTHDNDTTVSWFNSLEASTQNYVLNYLQHPNLPIHIALMNTAFASVAALAIIPMQDILGLGEGNRMNTPGMNNSTNWTWRFSWSQIPFDLASQLNNSLYRYDRLGSR